MIPIVFAKTEHLYQSYVDFWRLVELSGFETCFVKDIDLEREAIYIETPVNGEVRPHIKHRRSILKKPQQAVLVWWNLERPDSGDYELGKIRGNECVTVATPEIMEYFDHVWVSDRYLASMDSKTIYVPLGSDARLGAAPHPSKSYDICTLSYNNHRRDRIYGPMGQQYRMAPNSVWGGERDRVLRSSRCMVYVHQTPLPIGAPLRMALAAAYHLPVIAESSKDSHPHQDGHDVISAGYDELLGKTGAWLKDGRLASIGENLHRKLCVEMPFKKCVEEGVKATLG